MSVQERDLDVGELGEGAGERGQPGSRDRRDRQRLGLDHALPGVGNVRGAQERVRLGERGVDDARVIAAAAAPLERRGRGRPIARVRDGHEVMGDPDDAQRARELVSGDLPGEPLAVPALRQLSEGACHLVGQAQVMREESSTLAEVGGHQREAPVAAGQHPGEQAGTLGQRPVVRQVTNEEREVLAGL